MPGKVIGGTGNGYGAEVQIEGLVELRAALRAFEPELLKEMDKEIRTVSKELAGNASSAFGATGGTAAYKVRSSTRGKRVGQKVIATGNRNGNDWSGPVLAAILEFFGKVQPGKTPLARATTASLNARYGGPGRFLWKSWDAMKGHALPQIEAAVKRAEDELQVRMDAQGVA